MRPYASSSARIVSLVAVACTVSLLACGSDGEKAPPGTGGTGAGGSSASGGTPGSGGSTAQADAATTGTGGTTAASGGTTTTTGGKTGSSAAGGGGGTRPGSGGALATGGRTGNGGAAGGRTGSGGTAGGLGGTIASGTGGGAAGSSQPVPSEGCGKAGLTSGTQNITVGGAAREYILKVPDSYDKSHAYRLIFGFHGAKYNAKWVATGEAPEGGTPLSGPWFGLESESKGSAIFVAPQASGTWSATDLDFVDAMVAKLEGELCIDKSRVFSVGFSMGAIMTLRLGCKRSTVFRGIAPMSGALQEDCTDSRPVAYWASHGTKDTTIKIAEGEAARDEFIKRNHCSTTASSPNANNCVTYSGCDAGYPVVWCTWSGAHDPAPFAGPEIWSFIAPL